MDNRHPFGAQGGQHASADGLDGAFNGNGFVNHQYDNFFQDQSLDNAFDQSWPYAQSGAVSNQSVSPYDAWQSQTLQPHGLSNTTGHPYGQQLAHSPVPQTLPPAQLHNHASRQQQHHAFDPSLAPPNGHDSRQFLSPSTISPVATVRQPQSPAYGQLPSAPQQTVTPSAVEGVQQSQMPSSQRTNVAQSSVNQAQLMSAIPAAQESGIFRIVDESSISKSTGSKPIGLFVNLSHQDFEYPINRAVVPAAPVRKSRKQLLKLAASDPKLLTKLGKQARKVSASSGVIRVPKSASAASRQLSGASRSDVSLSDTSSSDYDSSDYDSDDEPELPSPLPEKRPDDNPKGAVRYDTLKALWRPQRYRLQTSDIKTGLKDFWEVVRTIRDRWKTDGAAVKAAEDKGRDGELPLLQSRVRDQREMVEVALAAALEHGHREILEVLSENKAFLYLCYQFLLDRFTQADYDSDFSRNMLKILAMCVTLTPAKVTETHLAKVLPRFTKKGNVETKALVAKVDAAIKQAEQETKEEVQTGKADSEKKPASPAANSPSATKVPVTGIKRPAPTTLAASGPASKKIAGTPPTTTTTSAATKTPVPLVKRPIAAATGIKAAAPSAAAAVKVKTAASKPSAFFNAMQSTTKKAAPVAKPAVSSVVASALKSVEKPPTAATTTSTKAGFSFADTMANLSKPKEKAPVAKPQPDLPAETPEQKARRLRKEARRGLRVTFKPDSSINEYRYFTHDPEEYDHNANMTRDAGDLMGEGRMFKQHKDQMDLDDEEDGPGEEELRPYKAPSLVNFDEIDPEEKARSYIPYGGGALTPESPEKTAREQHEANTLMVFYADASDIPPTPKEPPEDTDGDTAMDIKDFGAPQEWIMTRALKRTQPQQQQTQPVNAAQAAQSKPTAAPDLSALLAALNPQAQQAPPVQAPVYTPPPAAAPLANLQSILAQFSQANSATPPMPPQPPPAQAQGPNPAVANLIASLQAQQQPQPQPQQQYQQPQAPASTPDLSAILAAIQQNSGNNAAAPAQGFPAGFPVIPGFAPPAAQRPAYEADKQPANQNGDYRQFANKHFTQPCKYYPIGRCQKGTSCTYRHD